MMQKVINIKFIVNLITSLIFLGVFTTEFYLQILNIYKTKNEFKKLTNAVIFTKDLINREQQIKSVWYSYAKRTNLFYSPNDLVPIMLKIISSMGLLIHSVTPSSASNANEIAEDNFTFELSGTLSQFISFIAAMNYHFLPILLTEFQLHSAKDQIQHITFKLKIFYICNQFFSKKNNNNLNFPIANLFKNNEQSNLVNTHDVSPALILSVPFAHMRWVGFVRDNKHFKGLIKLPDEKTISFSVGDNVGMEHFKVISLNEKELIVQTSDMKIRKKYRFDKG